LLSREVRKFGCAFLSSQIGPEGSAPLPPWDLENTSHADLLPRSTHLRPRCAFGFPITRDHPITGSSDKDARRKIAALPTVIVSDRCNRESNDLNRRSQPIPPRPIFSFLLQTKTLFKSTQAWPLRDAWVALGPRLGHPRATQSQSQSAEGRNLLKTRSVKDRRASNRHCFRCRPAT
jgi:hypothetical protein